MFTQADDMSLLKRIEECTQKNPFLSLQNPKGGLNERSKSYRVAKVRHL